MNDLKRSDGGSCADRSLGAACSLFSRYLHFLFFPLFSSFTLPPILPYAIRGWIGEKGYAYHSQLLWQLQARKLDKPLMIARLRTRKASRDDSE